MSYISKFTPEVADKIISDILNAKKSLRTICREVGVNLSSLFSWTHEIDGKKKAFKPDFSRRYREAMMFSADVMDGDNFDEANNRDHDFYEINNGKGKQYQQPNNAAVNRSRLIIETRHMSQQHRNPERYAKLGGKTETSNSLTLVTVNYGKVETKTNGGFKPKKDNNSVSVHAERLPAPDTMGDG